MAPDHNCVQETQIALILKSLEDNNTWHEKNDNANEQILRTLRGYNGNPGIVGKLDETKKSQRWLWKAISAPLCR